MVENFQIYDTQYQVVSRKFKKDSTIIDVKGHFIGDGGITIIAGPCAIENRKQITESIKTLLGQGINFIRGGIYKPRTSPYSFQGLGGEGISIIKELKKEYDFNFVTEALDEKCLEKLLPVTDVVQVGSRNMYNFSFLKTLGKIDRPVFLKRGMAATIDEFLMAAEYIVINGNPNVILCERGIRTVSNHTRNTLDLSAVPFLKQKTHLPVFVDPSHGTGDRALVRAMARAAIAAGADGVMVEVHPAPAEALSDGYQSIDFDEFRILVDDILNISKAIGKNFSRK